MGKTQKRMRNDRWMLEKRLCMTLVEGDIEDRAIEGRIKYIDRGLGMVNFYIEMEGGRMKEKNFSDYPADFNPCHELLHAIQDILFLFACL